ncbi:hypothetical protein HG461_000060 [Candidatus Saccharibacteria bacterium]|nr:hypothetical protein [Candidatus Saccharibacteria bacterium]
MERIGNKNNAAESNPAPVVENKGNQEKKPEEKGLKIEAKDLGNNGRNNRKDILDYIREENEAALKQMVGLGLMDSRDAGKESRSMADFLRDEEEKYFREKNNQSKVRVSGDEAKKMSKGMDEDFVPTKEATPEESMEDRKHGEKVFLANINKAIGENIGIKATAEAKIDSIREETTKKLIDTKRYDSMRSSIQSLYDQGRIDKGLYKTKMASIDAIIQKAEETNNETMKDIAVGTYGKIAAEQIKAENDRYDNLENERIKTDEEIAKKRKEFVEGGLRGLTEAQQQELDKLEDKRQALIADQRKMNSLVSKPDEERIRERAVQIDQEEKQKAAARKEKLAKILGVPVDQVDSMVNNMVKKTAAEQQKNAKQNNSANIDNGDTKKNVPVNIDSVDAKTNANTDPGKKVGEVTGVGMSPISFMRMMMAGNSSKNTDDNSKDKLKNPDGSNEKIKGFNDYFENLSEGDSFSQRSAKIAMELLGQRLALEGDEKKRKAAEKFTLGACKNIKELPDDVKEKTKDLEEKLARADMFESVINDINIGRTQELAKKYGEDATFLYMRTELRKAHFQLLKKFNPQLAGQYESKMKGVAYDPKLYENIPSTITEEEYNTGTAVIDGLIKVFLDKIKGRDNLKSYYDAETKLSKSAKSEEYKKLVAEMKDSKDDNKVDSVPTHEIHEIDKSAEVRTVNVLSGDLAKDYILGFYDKDNATKYRDFMKGELIYESSKTDIDLNPEGQDIQHENNERIRQAMDKLNLDDIFRGSARELNGPDREFEGAYVYTELQRKVDAINKRLQTSGEDAPSKEEKEELSLQVHMVKQMMSGFTEYYSKRFNVEKPRLVLNFTSTMKGVKNRVRGLFRNLMRHRAI